MTAIPYTTEKVIAGMAGGIESLADFTTNVILGGGSWITSLGGTAKNPVSEFLDKQNKILQVTNPSEMYSQNIEKRYNMSNSTKRVGNVFEVPILYLLLQRNILQEVQLPLVKCMLQNI